MTTLRFRLVLSRKRQASKLAQIAIAHVNAEWVYPGGDDYRGLLLEHDVTEDAFARREEVRQWLGRRPNRGRQTQGARPYHRMAHCESLGFRLRLYRSLSQQRGANNASSAMAAASTGKLGHISTRTPSPKWPTCPTRCSTQQRRVKQATLTARTNF